LLSNYARTINDWLVAVLCSAERKRFIDNQCCKAANVPIPTAVCL